MLALLAIILSLGAVNALIPIIIILVLLIAAAGLNRGYSLFNLFGITTLASVNPGGKGSIGGKSTFSVLLLGAPFAGAGKTLNVGGKIKKIYQTRRKTKMRSTKFMDAYQRSEGFGRSKLRGRMAAAFTGSRAGRGVVRLATAGLDSKMGMRKRLTGGVKRAAHAAEKVSRKGTKAAVGAASGLGKVGPAAAMATRGITAPARGAARAVSGLRKIWAKRKSIALYTTKSRSFTIRGKTFSTKGGRQIKLGHLTTAAGLATTAGMALPLGGIFLTGKLMSSARRRVTSRAGLSYESLPHEQERIQRENRGEYRFFNNVRIGNDWSTLSSTARSIGTLLAPGPMLTLAGVQLVRGRVKNWREAEKDVTSGELSSGAINDKLNGIIYSHVGPHGDISKLSHSERRALERNLKNAINEFYTERDVVSGDKNRTTPHAVVRGTINLVRDMAEGYRSGTGAVRAGAARIRANIRDVGARPESTNPARLVRIIKNQFIVGAQGWGTTPPPGTLSPLLGAAARLHGTNIHVSSVGPNENFSNKSAQDHLIGIQQKTLSGAKDSTLLENARSKIEAELARLEHDMQVAAASAAATKSSDERLRRERDMLSKQEELLIAIAKNTNSSPATLNALLGSKAKESTIPAGPPVPGGVMAGVLEESLKVKAAVAGNKSTELTTLVSLAATSNPATESSVFEALGKNPSSNAALLGSIAANPAVKDDALIAIIHNQNTSDVTLRNIMHDKETQAAAAAATGKAATTKADKDKAKAEEDAAETVAHEADMQLRRRGK